MTVVKFLTDYVALRLEKDQDEKALKSRRDITTLLLYPRDLNWIHLIWV